MARLRRFPAAAMLAGRRTLSAEILTALDHNLIFQSAALPYEVFPPLFNKYEGGHAFGAHIDRAIRPNARGGRRIRADLSCTLFLSDPHSLDGGELVIEDALDEQSIKLPAGHMAIYPATTLHRVTPVTRGARVASISWVQSMIGEQSQRAILFDMDLSIQTLRAELGTSTPR